MIITFFKKGAGELLLLLLLGGCGGKVSSMEMEMISSDEKPESNQTSFTSAVVAFQQSKIVNERSCLSCHTIGNRGGTVGPILDQVSNRRSEEWLRKWLQDPNAVKPGTKMPNFQFTKVEIDVLVGYLDKLKKKIPSETILAAEMGITEKGRQLLEEYGCKACHRIGDEGRFIGVDLTWIGKRKPQAWEVAWLKNPQAWKPDTFMPNFALSEDEAVALSAYLHTLQGQHNHKGQLWEGRAMFFLGGSQVQSGKLVYQRFGCWGCHGKEGRKPDKNPNAAPDERIPKLWGVTNRLSDAEIIKTIKEGSTPPSLNNNEPPMFSCPRWDNNMTDSEMSDLLVFLRTLAPKKKKWRFK